MKWIILIAITYFIGGAIILGRGDWQWASVQFALMGINLGVLHMLWRESLH